MGKSLKNYTLKYLVYLLLVIIAVWAALFYAVILDEVYDNVDDGLKNQKINIIRAAYADTSLLNTRKFGINQFKMTPTDSIHKENQFSNEMIFMEYDDELEPYRVLKTGFYAPNGQPYSLEIRTSTVEEDDFRLNLSISLFFLYLMILITIYVVDSLVLTKALKPLDRILHYLQSYQIGSTHKQLNINTEVSEFKILKDKIDEMISRNEKLFRQQKIFIENAAHELQTPLAVTINQLELLLEDPNLSEKQLIELSEAKNSLHKMVSLNRSLLILSKINNQQFVDTQNLLLNTIIQQNIAEYKDILNFKNIHIDLKENGNFELVANVDLIKALISNLLRNAIRYNKTGGTILIDIQEKEIKIGNTSHLPPLNPALIFERFYKNSEDNTSTGLGLSIVESIVKTYPDLTLRYGYQEPMHYFILRKN